MYMWEKLVTPEHVRAARVRAWQFYIALAGIIIVLLVLWFVSPAPTWPDPYLRTEELNREILDLRDRAARTVKYLSTDTRSFSELKELPPSREVPSVLIAVLKSLNSGGTMPEQVRTEYLSHNAFWRGVWPNDTLVFTQRKSTKAIGAWVSVLPEEANLNEPLARRWVAILREHNEQWSAVSLSFPDNFSPESYPTVRPTEIPISLGALTTFR